MRQFSSLVFAVRGATLGTSPGAAIDSGPPVAVSGGDISREATTGTPAEAAGRRPGMFRRLLRASLAPAPVVGPDRGSRRITMQARATADATTIWGHGNRPQL